MAVPIDVATGPGGPEPQGPLSVPGQAIEGRSLGQIAWLRLRRDKVAMGGGVVVVLLILTAIIGPHLVQNPDAYNPNLINPTFLKPNGAFGGISLAHPLGVEPETAATCWPGSSSAPSTRCSSRSWPPCSRSASAPSSA